MARRAHGLRPGHPGVGAAGITDKQPGKLTDVLSRRGPIPKANLDPVSDDDDIDTEPRKRINQTPNTIITRFRGRLLYDVIIALMTSDSG